MMIPQYQEYAMIYAHDKLKRPSLHQKFVSSQKRYIFPFIGDLPLDRISNEDIGKIREAVGQFHFSLQWEAYLIGSTKNVLAYAVEKHVIVGTPAWNIKATYNLPGTRFPRTIEDHQRLIAEFDKLPFRNFIHCCYMLDVPFTHLLTIRCDYVDLNKRLFSIGCRIDLGTLPITDDIFPYMKAEAEKRERLGKAVMTDAFFILDDGRPILPAELTSYVHVMRVTLNQPDLSMQRIRGAYADYKVLLREKGRSS